MMVWKKALVIGAVFSVMVASGCKAIGGEQVTAAGSTQAKVDLVDISNHWAQASIISAVAKGYVDGYLDKSFRPNLEVSRAEFIKMVITALKLPVSTGNTSSDQWYSSYVNKAKEANIYVEGDFASGEFTQPITRAEMARLAVRAATDETGADVKKSMYLATKNGIINGFEGGELREGGTTTRAQAVTVIERILSIKNGEKLPSDKYATSTAEINWHKTNIITMLPRYFSKGRGPFSKDNFNADAMTFTAADGDFLNEVEKLVVVDWGDPNDPNRNLVPSDLKWQVSGTGQFNEIPEDCYIILSMNHIKVNRKFGISPAYSFATTSVSRIMPQGFDEKVYKEDSSTLLSSQVAISKSNFGDLAIELEYEGHHFDDLKEQRYIKGMIVPKGDLYSTGTGEQIFTVDIGFPKEFGGKPTRIYESDLDPNSHQ